MTSPELFYNAPGEEMLAEALERIAPPKIEGGSKARQQWLDLVIQAQVYLHENGFNMHLFVETIQGVVHNVPS